MMRLEMQDAEGNYLTDSFIRIDSLMHFPDSQRLYDLGVAAQVVASRLHHQQALEPHFVKIVNDRGGMHEALKLAKKVGRSRDGRLAGDVLLFALSHARRDQEQASILKAIYAIARITDVGERTIEAAWQRFKPVSHLWAAADLVGDSVDCDEDAIEFAAAAAALAEQAIQAGLLKQDDFYRLGYDFQGKRKVQPEPLTDDDLQILERYENRHRAYERRAGEVDQDKKAGKMRNCLNCKAEFYSEWAGHRLCRRCR